MIYLLVLILGRDEFLAVSWQARTEMIWFEGGLITFIDPSINPTHTSEPSSVYLVKIFIYLFIPEENKIRMSYLRLNISFPQSTAVRTLILPSRTGPMESCTPCPKKEREEREVREPLLLLLLDGRLQKKILKTTFW